MPRINRRFPYLVMLLAGSVLLVAACADDNGNGFDFDDTGDTGELPGLNDVPDGTPTAFPEVPDLTPDANGTDDGQVAVSIADGSVMVQPSVVADTNVQLQIANTSMMDHDLYIVAMEPGQDPAALADEVAMNGTDGIDVIEEATITANGEQEITAEMEPGAYLVLAADADGMTAAWAEFTVQEPMAATN